MKLNTLFIPIIHERDGKQELQLISTKRIKIITDLLPTLEEIRAHLRLENLLMIKNNGYMPQPYMIKVSTFEFGDIVEEIQKRHPRYYSESISLMASSESATIIKIVQKDNS